MSDSKSWVKFKRSHPKFAHFVGDIVELSDKILEGEGDKKGLNELGYTIPATKAEILEAKANLEKPKKSQSVRTGDAMTALIEEQQKKIDELTDKLAAFVAGGDSAKAGSPGLPPAAPAEGADSKK